MPWTRVWGNATDPPSYTAEAQGGPGDGEVLHAHTIAQSFEVFRGRIYVAGDVPAILGPGEAVWAPSGAWHGVLVLEPGTIYRSVFWEQDGGPIDRGRITREQVPSITPAEAAQRAAELAAGVPYDVIVSEGVMASGG